MGECEKVCWSVGEGVGEWLGKCVGVWGEVRGNVGKFGKGFWGVGLREG